MNREGSVTLGLIPAPDIPEKIAQELASELPDLLSSRVDGGVSWDVPVVVDPLTGTDREAPEILDECRQKMLSEGWDLAGDGTWTRRVATDCTRPADSLGITFFHSTGETS